MNHHCSNPISFDDASKRPGNAILVKVAGIRAKVDPMKRGKVHPQSWDAGIRAAQCAMLEFAGSVPLNDEQAHVLTAAFMRCEELSARKYLAIEPTNRELAAKYGTCERTVRYWRREGCPFDKGQARVLKWIAGRRYAPAGTEAKFSRQLERRRLKRSVSLTQQALAEVRELRWLHLQHGSKPPDWMRNIRARRGKVPYFDPTTCKPIETSLQFEGERRAKPHG